jgi:Leucine-rich repeat (LRR) protein
MSRELISILKYFRLILISLVCLIAGDAFEREIECNYLRSFSYPLWPSVPCCFSSKSIDYTAFFETAKHSIAGTRLEKRDTKMFFIFQAAIDFIPLDILTEFPNLNGLYFDRCRVPTVKSGLFTAEFRNIEFLHLGGNGINLIEPSAFQHLLKLKWISLQGNNLQALSHKLFRNNTDLIYINLKGNGINSIHPSFFDGLSKLKLVDFRENLCLQTQIGCETCLITQADLKSKVKKCFDNCSIGSDCHTNYVESEYENVVEELSDIQKKLNAVLMAD